MSRERVRGMSIAQIEVLACRQECLEAPLWTWLETDRRIGVRRLAVRRRRQLQRHLDERARLEELRALERRLWARGVQWVAGVDEAGRGCLAGPVVAAAVVLPPDALLPGLDDSKKLRPAKRQALFEAIGAASTAVGVGAVEAAEIDRINILQAALKAMRLALADLGVEPQQVLVDGTHKPGSAFAETVVVDGDARALCIAAASVVAKVHRDRLMLEWDARYPRYGFAAHKGYGSPAHLEALARHGPCPLHRRSFAPVAARVRGEESEPFRRFREGLARSGERAELERLGALIGQVRAELLPGEVQELRRIYRKRLRACEDTGKRGEAAAADFLRARGYVVLERSYRGGGGEIDLVARQGDCLVFVEVKTSHAGRPEERVGPTKQTRLVRAARHYLQCRAGPGRACRLDVISVVLGGRVEIAHFENAFQAPSSL